MLPNLNLRDRNLFVYRLEKKLISGMGFDLFSLFHHPDLVKLAIQDCRIFLNVLLLLAMRLRELTAKLKGLQNLLLPLKSPKLT